MKLEERLLIITIVLNHLYIVLLNTSSVHGLTIPNERIFTGFLVIILSFLTYIYLENPATEIYEKLLYFAVIFSLFASILRTFGVSVQIVSYAIMIISIAIFTTVPLLFHRHKQLKIMLFGLYSIETILLISRVFDIDNIVLIIGPLVELFIVMGILYYNYSMGFAFDELFLVVIASITGWYLGIFIFTEFDVPTLIISTLFEQTLSVSQYSIVEGIEAQFFFSLHIAEVFNILMVQFLTRRSWKAMGIFFVGLDMTYPPLMFVRSILVLIFMRESFHSIKTKEAVKND